MADTQAHNARGGVSAAGTHLQLLLFRLDSPQLYGINVFKVREVIPWQPLTAMAGSHPRMIGVVTVRNQTMPVIDLAAAMELPMLAEPRQGQIIISEHNRSAHGFLVGHVARIVNADWNQVKPMPSHLGRNIYATGVTLIDKAMVQIVDVEKILDQMLQASTEVSSAIKARRIAQGQGALVVDDSAVARQQIQGAMEQLGVECTLVKNGPEALRLLSQLQEDGIDIASRYPIVISDIEMPGMDGYELTSQLRAAPHTRDMRILLHSSINGIFDAESARRTGADTFVQKYDPDELARAVLACLEHKAGLESAGDTAPQDDSGP